MNEAAKTASNQKQSPQVTPDPKPDAGTKTEPDPIASPATDTKRLYRLPKSGKIAGVCAGLAAYLNMDVTVMRLIFVVLALASGGFGIVVYIILAIVMPTSDATLPQTGKKSTSGTDAGQLASEVRDNGGVDRLRSYVGLALVLFGAWLLLLQFFPGWINLNWNYIWPALLIGLGLVVVLKSRSAQ